MINDTTIIIPTRANLEYLQAAISSIRDKSQYDAVKILVGADNPPQEVRDWLAENNKGQYDYTIYEAPTGKERTGIVNMVEDLVERVKTKFVYYMHDDMIIGEKTLENLVRAWKNKRILSSFRVEPPIYQNSKEKLLADIGTEPSEFDANKFSQIEQDLCQENKKVLVEGFFAPHFFAKKDWVGYDHIFEPQSREDSDLAQRFLDDNCELYTVWDSVVYHFSGKGSRKKDSSEDSQEWKMTNYKNTRNYIRKWKTLKHTEYILPLRAPDIKVGATVLACDRDVEYVDEFLDNVEPWFDEIVFIIDSNTSKITEVDKAIKQFIKKQE